MLWITGINIVKMSLLPKAAYRLHGIPISLAIHFVTDTERIILSFIQKQKIQDSCNNFE